MLKTTTAQREFYVSVVSANLTRLNFHTAKFEILLTNCYFVFLLTYFSKPTGMLRGHNAPIFSLYIAADENRVYSISQDKTIKVSQERLEIITWCYRKLFYIYKVGQENITVGLW